MADFSTVRLEEIDEIDGDRMIDPYEPNGWEMFAPLCALFESGGEEEGADRAGRGEPSRRSPICGAPSS